MKTFILDYSKWRCGGNREESRLGKGITSLENGFGFMCCLGQYCKQEDPKLTLSIAGSPKFLKKEVKLLSYRNSAGVLVDTKLAQEAISINDSVYTTPGEKIEKLRKIFKRKGIKIRVINRPK